MSVDAVMPAERLSKRLSNKRTHARHLTACLAALCLVIATGQARAEAEIQVVVGTRALPHNEFVAGFERGLVAAEAGTRHTIRVSTDVNPHGAAAIVAAGADALRSVSATNPSVPVVYGLVPRALVPTSDDVKAAPQGPRAAVVLDQPYDRRMALIRAVLPRARRIAVLYGPSSRLERSAVEAAVADRGLHLVQQTVLDADELHDALSRVLRDADVLLALPDPLVYGAGVVKSVLLETYRQRVPVFAYSSAWVTAGALAAIYSAPGDLGQQTASVTLKLLHEPASAQIAIHAPAEFRIDINEQVARSLDIAVPDRARIRERIEADTTTGDKP